MSVGPTARGWGPSPCDLKAVQGSAQCALRRVLLGWCSHWTDMAHEVADTCVLPCRSSSLPAPDSRPQRPPGGVVQLPLELTAGQRSHTAPTAPPGHQRASHSSLLLDTIPSGVPSYHTAASSLGPTTPRSATPAPPGAPQAQPQPQPQGYTSLRQHAQSSSPHHRPQLQVVRLDSPRGSGGSSMATPYRSIRESESSYGGDHLVRHVSQAALSTTEPHVAPGLQARPFQLSYTLLQHLVGRQGHQQQQQQQGNGQQPALSLLDATTSVLEGLVVADCGRWVQDLRHPSRDVCMIMERRGGGSTEATPGAAEAEEQGVAQSVVVLGLVVGGGSALGLYLACPLRLPGPLLEGVRGSCVALLRTVSACGHGPCVLRLSSSI